MRTRRHFIAGMAAGALAQTASSGPTRYARYRTGGDQIKYGVVEGESVRDLSGHMFDQRSTLGTRRKLSEVELLHPCEPPKVLAVGLNYKSHLGNQPAPRNPEIFYKPVTCLMKPGGKILIPRDAKNVHYEGELVIVIGKPARDVSVAQARDAIFGVTCGNDVSERDWQGGQQKDLQWWRAKGADTFGPLGPYVVRGLDYGKLMLETRLNGKVVQKQSTSDLLFDCPAIVSFVSRYVTLTAGDVIYTGTPGATQRMSPGDVVEVEIEGIGVLKNQVAAA